MLYSSTTALRKIAGMKHRLKIIQGGTSAGKTIALLLLLINRAQTEENKVFSVVSETLPHLRKGAIRDFLSIMEGHKYYDDNRWNRTDNIYTFETGTKIEFFSADSPDKVRGPRRDVLFINECNNVSYETYTQLSIRTNEDIYLDYNPVAEFWVHTEIIIPGKPHDFIIVTYKDNEALPQAVVEEIESRKDKKYFWQVYGLGQLGEVEGKIYSGWEYIDEVPHEARLFRRGLDFGYSNDPAALVDIYEYNGGFVLDEILYEKKYSNRKIADLLISMEEQVLVIGDSSEPKSIDEMKGYGINIIGAKKGAGSITQGIAFMQDQKISVTRKSTNLIREYRNYVWKTDDDGKVLPVPEDRQQDHALDAARYGFNGQIGSGQAEVHYSRSKVAPYGRRQRAYSGVR